MIKHIALWLTVALLTVGASTAHADWMENGFFGGGYGDTTSGSALSAL